MMKRSWEVQKNNAGTITLYYAENDKLVYVHHYDGHEEDVASDIEALRNGESPICAYWDNNFLEDEPDEAKVCQDEWLNPHPETQVVAEG